MVHLYQFYFLLLILIELIVFFIKSFLRKLHQEIRSKNVDKIYDLIVFGNWPKELKIIDAPLSKRKSKTGEKEAIVENNGKNSLTEFSLIESNNKYSHLKAKIITGRMHQIRAHTTYKGFPIVGDRKYGNELLNKQAKDCLLSTSPSPRDVEESRMPSCA